MGKNRILQHAVHAALAAAAATVTVPVAYSQTAPAATTEAASTDLQEVVVTGSRLQTANLVSISPVTTVTALDIQQSGLTRVEDILNNLPSVMASQGSTLSNGADGTATVDLHDLGPQRTLVLINGRRLAPGAPDGRNYADINQIPAELIERVDVLTGGASSTYGADAVAGVVNFVMNTHYEGVRIDGQYSLYNHNNHEDQYSALNAADGYPTPANSVNSAFGKNFSIIAGSNFADGAGNATFYTTYDQQASAIGAQFDYSACTLAHASGGGAACGGSATNRGGTFLAYNSTGNILFDTIDPKTGILRPYAAGDDYNYGALNYYMRPSERWTAGSYLNYDINASTNVYAELSYMRNDSVAQIAQSGDFANNPLTLNCGPVGVGLPGNPLITAQERSVLCAPSLLALQGQAPGGTLDYYLLRRNVEGGGRQEEFTNDSWRTVIGVTGDFATAWKYNAYAQIGITDEIDSNKNYFSTANLLNAEEVVEGPTGPVCSSGAAGCVPYNFWVPGGVTPAALKYLTIPLYETGTVREYVAHADVSSDLGKYNIQIPMAKSGPQVNVGAEYRQESSQFNPDLASEEGLGAGGAGEALPLSGEFHVSEAFAEFNLPIIDGMPGVDQLAANGGYRYSDYTLGFKTNTYKFGVEYAPVSDIRFRATYNQSVRAPNIGELYTVATIGPGGTTDPCWGPTPALTEAQCALTGVSAAQYGHIGANPASQFNTSSGGNPALIPEIAHTWAYGFVFQPAFLPTFNMSLDYYDIRITGAIESQSASSIILNCALTGNAEACDSIHRDANGSLWLTTNGYVNTAEQNTGVIETKGVDLKINYSLDLAAAGKVAFNLEGTDAISNTTQPNVTVANTSGTGPAAIPGPSYNCSGYWGQTCDNPLPKWRSVFTADWSTPWTGLDFLLRWRFIGSSSVDALSQSPLLNNPAQVYPGYDHISNYSYLDASVSANVLSNVNLRLGVNNVLDKDPPVILSGDCPTGPCNNNTWSQTYDPIGRYIYVHATVKF